MRASAIILAILCWVSVSFALDQGEGRDVGRLDWYAGNAKIVIGNARRQMEPVLSDEERRIARSIDYRVPASWNIRAYAGLNGGRVVVIPAGFVAVFEMLSQAYIVANETGRVDCFPEYLDHVGRGILDNSARMGDGGEPRPVYTVFAYAEHSAGQCADIKPSDYIDIPNAGATNAKFVEASIVSIYLHELAHHVLGHVDGDVPDSAKSREQEDEADIWAMRTAFAADYSLVGAAPWHYLVSAIGGNSIEAERQSSHPLGQRRVLHLYEAALDHYQNSLSGQKLLKRMEDRNNFLTELRNSVKQLQDELRDIR